MTCLEEPQCLIWGCHLGRLYFFFSKVQLAAGTQSHHRLLAVGYPGSGVTGFAVLHSAKEGGNVKEAVGSLILVWPIEILGSLFLACSPQRVEKLEENGVFFFNPRTFQTSVKADWYKK